MRTEVYSVFDAKTKAYMQPFQALTKGEAIRGLDDNVNSGKSMLSRHPEDFCLFKLGTFDDQVGRFECLATPEPIITCKELVHDSDNVTPLERATQK